VYRTQEMSKEILNTPGKSQNDEETDEILASLLLYRKFIIVLVMALNSTNLSSSLRCLRIQTLLLQEMRRRRRTRKR
jgi:hypothetical protein